MSNEIRRKIIDAAIMAFNIDGVKFTMDTVAQSTGMSKKTIYKYFESKDDLILAAVNEGFDEVKRAEQRIISNPDLDIVEKLKQVIVVIPDQYISVDWRRLKEFEDYSPRAFKQISERVSTGWDSTFALLNEATREGKLREVNPAIFKSMVDSCIAGFINDGTLVREGIAYRDALAEMINILIEGIRK